MAKVLIPLAGLVATLLAIVGFLLAAADPATDVPLELAKALINLTVALLITGVLSYVLTQRSARQARLDDRAGVLARALQDLKAGYERVQVARFFLMAHRTCKTFAEQITTMTEARALLHRVQRERYVLGTDVDNNIQKMLDHLTAVTDEYKQQCTRITEDALKEECARRRVLEGLDERLADTPLLPPQEFPCVTKLLDESHWKTHPFNVAYGSSKEQLHDWLDESATRDSSQWTRRVTRNLDPRQPRRAPMRGRTISR